MINGVWKRQEYIVDGTEVPNINDKTANINFSAGQPFNGVLYFEGNVRVRGIIPTDVQLSLVSNASIFIEGSITKGTMGNDVTDSYNGQDPIYGSLAVGYDLPLTRPSRSSLMLMAKDYVVLNTTQFCGFFSGQDYSEVNDQANDTGFNALDMSANASTGIGTLDLTADLLTDPTTGNALNPQTWTPYAMNYVDSVNTGTQIPTQLLLTHTMADNPGAASFIMMNVNPGSFAQSIFNFPGTGTALPGYSQFLSNTATNYLNTGAGISRCMVWAPSLGSATTSTSRAGSRSCGRTSTPTTRRRRRSPGRTPTPSRSSTTDCSRQATMSFFLALKRPE